MKNKTIMITGATGYLGNILANKILNNMEYNLILLGLNKNEVFRVPDDVRVKKYFLSETPLKEIFESNKIDTIVHTATLYGRRNEELSAVLSANVEFPLSCLALAIENGVRNFINTDTILSRFTSPYSLSKKQFVDWLDMYSDKIKVINMQLDHFYGPFDKPVKFVAWLIEQFKNKVEKIDLTEGTQTRDFIYISDVVDAYICVLHSIENISSGKRNNFEVGTGSKISIRDFVKMLKASIKDTKTALNFGAVPLRKNEVLDYDIDNSALKALGWEPKYNIQRGIKEIVETEGLA